MNSSIKKKHISFSYDKKKSDFILSFIILFLLSFNAFGQIATEDFNPTGNVFGGGVSGTNWVNNSWIRSGGNTNVQALNPSDTDDNIGGNLLQLDNNNAGAYRTVDLSTALTANLTFDYDYDSEMDGNETLRIQIDHENDGTYVTLQTITATDDSPNPEVNLSIGIPSAFLGGTNTRIRFITGGNNGRNANGEDWWIDNISLNIAITIGTDTDGDGVADNIDQDDDNDGIPDFKENNLCGSFLQEFDFETPQQANINGNNVITGTAHGLWNINIVNGFNIVRVDGTGYDFGPDLAASGTQYVDVADGAGNLTQDFTVATTGTYFFGGYFSNRDNNTSDPLDPRPFYIPWNGAVTIFDGTTVAGVSNSIPVNSTIDDDVWYEAIGSVTLTAGVTYTFSAYIGNFGHFDSGILRSGSFYCDTDGDSIPDYLDLDSDNDGIYDAVEAGHGETQTNGRLTGVVGIDGIADSLQALGEEDNGSINYTISDINSDGTFDAYQTDSDGDGCSDVNESLYTDDNDDGLLGPLPVIVDANGLVTSGSDGYVTPADRDTNSIFDFQEVGVAPSIVTEPMNTIICPGCTGTITVVAGNTDIYQWQLFDGTDWVDITNTGIYNGTDSNTLTLTNVSASDSGNQYRVILSSNTYVCDTISITAILNVRVRTVITNKRITYRVKKN